MPKAPLATRAHRRAGFTLLEVLLATSLFALFATAITGGLLYGQESTALAGKHYRASLLAEEGLEAVRNRRDSNFGALANGTYGLNQSGNQWVLSGSQDMTDIFTRQITISSLDANTKQVQSTVNWQQTGQRTGQLSLTTRLTNWRATVVPPATPRGGILVYGNGGTTTDAMLYRRLDGPTGTWGAASALADVDGATANRAARAVQTYASSTRDEKIVLSRHSNGTTQYIYGQIYNGTTWGNVVLLASWNNNTFLDVQNFSGTYLSSGDFMVVYSDNTTTPKFRTWNGTTWSGQVALPATGGIPVYVVAKARPGTNEVMTAFFDQSNDTNTAYFNGGSYATASWTVHAEHAVNAPVNTKQLVDFAWSPNSPTRGGLVYANITADLAITIKVWTANGTGGGSWSAAANTSNQASRLGALSIRGRAGADEFTACDKDANGSPRIICYRSNFTPAWANPTNQTLVTGSDTGIQRSYDVALETESGNPGLAVYSDTTALPKLKQYDPVANSWAAAATSLPTVTAALETVRIIPKPDDDDLMILLGNTSQDLFSVVWDGTANALYTTPAGKAFSAHGISGVADENFWFDFAWDGL